ncbi:MAG: hypothetical protein ACU0AZ_07705 [Paracoccaceae bacterium]|jgi:hypothetical protein
MIGVTWAGSAGAADGSSTWNTVSNVTSASLASEGAELQGSSIGQTERGEVILTFWRPVSGEYAGQVFQCVDIERYQQKLSSRFCRLANPVDE